MPCLKALQHSPDMYLACEGQEHSAVSIGDGPPNDLVKNAVTDGDAEGSEHANSSPASSPSRQGGCYSIFVAERIVRGTVAQPVPDDPGTKRIASTAKRVGRYLPYSSSTGSPFETRSLFQGRNCCTEGLPVDESKPSGDLVTTKIRVFSEPSVQATPALTFTPVSDLGGEHVECKPTSPAKSDSLLASAKTTPGTDVPVNKPPENLSHISRVIRARPHLPIAESCSSQAREEINLTSETSTQNAEQGLV